MVDRVLHYAPGWDAPAWAKWAQGTGAFKDQVIAFAMQNPELVEVGESQLPREIENKLKATPRSLEYFNALYDPDLSEGMLNVISQGILGRTPAEAFLRQHQDERPLSFEALLEGRYDGDLRRWAGGSGSSYIAATSTLMVTGLVDRPVDTKTAQRLGRYLALIPTNFKEQALAQLLRSAPEWVDPLKQTSARWSQHFAREQASLPGGSPQLGPLR
jgi:hypothetical protein